MTPPGESAHDCPEWHPQAGEFPLHTSHADGIVWDSAFARGNDPPPRTVAICRPFSTTPIPHSYRSWIHFPQNIDPHFAFLLARREASTTAKSPLRLKQANTLDVHSFSDLDLIVSVSTGIVASGGMGLTKSNGVSRRFHSMSATLSVRAQLRSGRITRACPSQRSTSHSAGDITPN